MSVSENSGSVHKSKSIYDITSRIEEELTYIYEMRMKESLKKKATKETVTEKNSPDQSSILAGNQNLSLFAR